MNNTNGMGGVNNIYIVGFMGTGKSSVGRELARLRNTQFVDLDKSIELKEKRRISEIFAKEGEPFFRKLEKEALMNVSLKNSVVVACGGGIVIDKDNIRVMKETGKIICLTATPEAILKRTSGCADRPLLNVADPKQQIALLLEKRAPYYALADETVDTSNSSVKEVVNTIVKLILK
jgi:shikimate kinase